MCLGIPGKVIHIEKNPTAMTMGKVNFGGIIKDVCLAYVPDVKIDDYVVVHVGFAISKVNEQAAAEIFKYLQEIEDLSELDIPQPS